MQFPFPEAVTKKFVKPVPKQDVAVPDAIKMPLFLLIEFF